MFRRLIHTLKFTFFGLVLLAVLFGCRDNRDGSSPEFILDNSFASVESLTEGFLKSLENGDIHKMQLMAADKDEFESYLWPYLPASKPGTNLTSDFVWEQSRMKSLSSLRSTVSRYGGKEIKLVGVELSGGVREYGRLKLFMDPEVIVSIDGVEQKTRMFGAIMTLEGEYKIYSYSL